MKTVVIPDLHHHTRWVDPFLQALYKKEPFDEVVYLGDYFDDWNDGPNISRGTALWLKERLNSTYSWKEIFLIGNHDLPYLIPTWNDAYFCPGFDIVKDAAINNVLSKEDWDKLKSAHYTQGWLLSHAGFSFNLVCHPVLGVPSAEELVSQAEAGLVEAKNGNWNKFFVAGRRMGTGFEGGIIWSDWNEEYIPIVGTPQIVGHTPGSFVRAKRVTKEQKDYCLDCENAAVIMITDGEVEIIKTRIKK